MKVLFDNQIFKLQKFGGISRYFKEIMQIDEVGIDVASIETLVEMPREASNNLLRKSTKFLKNKFRPKSGQPNPALHFTDKLSQATFDIFHPTYYDPYFLALTDKPFVLTVFDMIHEIYSEYFNLAEPVSAHKRILCEKAAKIITISETTKADLIDIFKIPASKVHAIPLASDFKNVIPQKPEGAAQIDKDYILFVGVRSGYKNFYFSIIALSELLKNDDNICLLCTGHEFSNDEKEMFRQLKIEHRVKHIYPRNDSELAWVYQNAKVFIFPSLYEGFGLPLLEAFSKDCPVISSKGGSLEEVAGDAVLYFDPKKSCQIREAAQQVLYDNRVRENLVIKGREQLSKFSWTKCRTETAAVYREVYSGYN